MAGAVQPCSMCGHGHIRQSSSDLKMFQDSGFCAECRHYVHFDLGGSEPLASVALGSKVLDVDEAREV